MAATDVKVTFTGDTSQLAAASKTANAAIASTGAAAAAADAKIKALKDSNDAAADKIGKVGGASNKLAGFLSVLSPGLADATQSIGDLADGGELAAEASAALGVSLGAVAAGAGLVLSAVALLAAAYAGWNEEAATATRLTEQQNALTAATAPLYADTEAAIRGAKVELGLMTEAQATMIEAGISGLEQYQTATEDTRKRLNELRAAQSSITGQVGALVGDIGEALPLQEYNMLAQIIDGVTVSTSEFDTEEGKLHDGLIATSGELKRNREAHAALTDAKEKGAAATEKFTEMEKAAESAAQARADAEARLKETLKERAEAEEKYAAGVAALRQIEADANADRLTEIEALDAARAQQMTDLNAMLTEQLAAAKGNELRQQEIEQAGRDARLAIEQRYQRDKGEIVAEGNAAVAEANAAAQADAAATQAATQDAQIALAQAGAQSLVDITSAIYGGMTDAGLKKGLKAAFAASKAAALAQAGINTALAFSNALAAPLPPPLPQIAAAAALVSGLAAAAGIAAQQPPSFRSGYMPDQQLAMIEPGSEIVAPASAVQNLGGMERAREAFAGVSGGGAPVINRFVMGHREFSAVTENSARRPGPLRDLTVRPGAGRVNPYSRGSNG